MAHTRKARLTYREAVRAALDRALSDPGVVFMGEDVGGYGGAFGVSKDLWKKYPGRVIETPISEGGFTGMAVGMAMTGWRVVVEVMFMDFLTLSMDQLVNHAANIHYMYAGQVSCPLVVRTPAGGYRGYGASHSKSMENMLMGVPGLKVVAPYSVEDAYGLLLSAVYDNNPVVFVEHKLLYDSGAELDMDRLAPIPIGKASIAREGDDLTIAAHSYGVSLALDAAEMLSQEGIEAEIVDLRTIKPLDTAAVVESVKKTGRLVTVEECTLTGGVGAEVASRVVEECLPYLDGRVVRVGRRDVPIPAAMPAERMVLPKAADVAEAAKRSLSWG